MIMPSDQQNHVDHQQDEDGIIRQTCQQIDRFCRHAVEREHIGEGTGTCDQDHDHCCRAHRRNDCCLEFIECYRAVDQHSYQERVNGSESAGFRDGENA